MRVEPRQGEKRRAEGPGDESRFDKGDDAGDSVGHNTNPDIEDILAVEEAAKLLGSVDISEVYSPERFKAVAGAFGLSSGLAADLRTGWDFNYAEHRSAAREQLHHDRPYLLVASPMCAKFSILQHLVKYGSEEEKEKVLNQARVHINFVLEELIPRPDQSRRQVLV